MRVQYELQYSVVAVVAAGAAAVVGSVSDPTEQYPFVRAKIALALVCKRDATHTHRYCTQPLCSQVNGIQSTYTRSQPSYSHFAFLICARNLQLSDSPNLSAAPRFDLKNNLRFAASAGTTAGDAGLDINNDTAATTTLDKTPLVHGVLY